MKTITKTINVYAFDELSERAKDNAIAKYADFDSSDYEATLEAFSDAMDISVYKYRVGDCVYGPFANFVNGMIAENAEEIDSEDRLRTFVWNNFYEAITSGKYYSRGKWIDNKYHYIERHSNINREYTLTGFCADYAILSPVIDFLANKEHYASFNDLINNCLKSFLSAWDADMEYAFSYDGFSELANANDWEFDESGNMV